MTKLLMAIQQANDYAAREAAAPELQHFAGGDALGVTLTILLIVLVVVLIWWLLKDR
jgi:ribose/xylose/arabinose/galactoside ABC-type transport system permease subunit